MIFEADVFQTLGGRWRGEVSDNDAVLHWGDFDTKKQADNFCFETLATFMAIEEELDGYNTALNIFERRTTAQ